MSLEKLVLPQTDVSNLESGQWVLLNGRIFTARDQAHKRMVEEGLPFSLQGQALYYAGPCPKKPNEISGPIGPTTSSRMDAFTPFLLQKGLKVMIGKGQRSKDVKEAIKRYQAAYLVTVGGAGAYIADKVKKLQVVAYSELGSEAIYQLEVEDLPALVAIDASGKSIFD